MARFTVDTHLFRELGELLVGRESTALVELIKNAYDADATQVTVHGENLHEPSTGRIVISDNGVGMTPPEFEGGFLRIASRIKEEGSRSSIKFNRRFTGAKGIGRLAAHKLARFIRIYSVPSREKNDSDRVAVNATIDWDIVENYQTLEELGDSGAIQLSTEPILGKAKPGTTIELKRLRKKWSPAERARFFAEVQT
ncbi:MAG: ATP-binding protein, partial [Candidatus Binatia bacterium]